MLIVGGGIIGLEMATVYATLGSEIDIVELQDGLIPGCDRDLVRPLQKRLEGKVGNIMLKTRLATSRRRRTASRFHSKATRRRFKIYDKVLVAVGRTPERQTDQRQKRPVCRSTSEVHPDRCEDAHQCPAHLCDRRRGRQSDAGAQGDPRGKVAAESSQACRRCSTR